MLVLSFDLIRIRNSRGAIIHEELPMAAPAALTVAYIRGVYIWIHTLDEGSKSFTRSLSFTHSKRSSLFLSSRCETSSSSSVLALFSSVTVVSKVFMAYIESINTKIM